MSEYGAIDVAVVTKEDGQTVVVLVAEGPIGTVAFELSPTQAREVAASIVNMAYVAEENIRPEFLS